jgi:hypothetical protein
MPAQESVVPNDRHSVLFSSSRLDEVCRFFGGLQERVVRTAIANAATRVEAGAQTFVERSDILAVGPEVLSDVLRSFEQQFSDHESAAIRQAS